MAANMIRNSIPLILAGLLIAAVSFGIGFKVARCTESHTLVHLQETAWMEDQLSLTSDQVEKMKAIEEEFNAKLLELCDEHCAARNALGDLLWSDAWSLDAERNLLEEMGRAQVKTDATRLAHIRRIHATLAPDQQERYEIWVRKCLYTACPHHQHHGGLSHDGGVQ